MKRCIASIVVLLAPVTAACKPATTQALQTATPVATVAAKPAFVEVAPTKTKTEPADEGWEFATDKDSMTDEVFTFARRKSKAEEPDMLGRPTETMLMYRCNDSGLDLIYLFDTVLIPDFDFNDDNPGSKFKLSIRFNDEPVQSGVMETLKSNKGVFLPNGPFLSRTSGTVTIRATGMNDKKFTSTFKLDGIAEVASKLPCLQKASE